MAPPRKFDEPATERLFIRVTPSQRRDLGQVAKENRSSMADVIREAVDEYVADYREHATFRLTNPGH